MKIFWLIFCVILFIAALPRAVELISGNYLFQFDQGNFFQEVKHIIVDHKPTLIGVEIGNTGGFFQGPGWYYLLAIPFILDHGNPYGAMVLMFILGMATVFFSIFLTKNFSTKTIALCIGFFLAASVPIISQSRFIWPPFPVSLLTVFYLYFLFNVFLGKSKQIVFALFILSLMFHFESAMGATLFLQLILFSPVLFYKRLISLKSIIYSVPFFVIPFAPLIIFDLRHNFIATRGMIAFFSHSSSHINYLSVLQNHIAVFKSIYLGVVPFPDLFSFIFLLFIFICSIFYLRDTRVNGSQKIALIYLLISPFLLFVIFMAIRLDIWPWWLFELYIIYCYYFGTISGWLLGKRTVRIFGIIIIAIFLFNYLLATIKFYKEDLSDYGGTAKIKGKIDAIDYIYKDAKSKKFNLLIFAPAVYTYDYDYLLWWYGFKKYHYLPLKEKKDTLYLLMEPDPGKPWTYKGWLETVIKTGIVEKEVTLPSGFIIQKRIMLK